MTAIGQSAITIIVFLVVLGTLVLVHEVGHFVAARLSRVTVLEFGVGFPPRARILGRGKPTRYQLAQPPRPAPALPVGIEPGSPDAEAFLDDAAARSAPVGTLYTLNWLPIGGFVKLEGEDGDANDDPTSFGRARLAIKLLILVAGVVMNLVLSFAIFTGIALYGEPALGLKVGEVVPGSPAEAAGVVAGDVLVSVNGARYSAFGGTTAVDDLHANAGKPVTIGIVHPDGSASDLSVTLRVPTDPKQGALGVGQLTGVQEGTLHYSPGEAVALGVQRTREAFGMILSGLGDLGRSIVTDPTSAPEASGPVGIAVQIGDVLWSLGPLYVLYLAGLLSANLALVNILPFPPLDGGRMLVIALKAVPRYGPRISIRAERLTYVIGFVALFTFLIWITVFDVARQLGG